MNNQDEIRIRDQLRSLNSAEYRTDIFKGLDAKIQSTVTKDQSFKIIVCRWEGNPDGLAGISVELMLNIKADAAIGDVLSLGGLHVTIVDYTPQGQFWYVRLIR